MEKGDACQVKGTLIYTYSEVSNLAMINKKLKMQPGPHTPFQSCIFPHQHPQVLLPSWDLIGPAFEHLTYKNSDNQNSPQDYKAAQQMLPSA